MIGKLCLDCCTASDDHIEIVCSPVLIWAGVSFCQVLLNFWFLEIFSKRKKSCFFSARLLLCSKIICQTDMTTESVRNTDRMDFLSSIPPPIIRMLTHLSPIARFITSLVHIVTWHPTTPASHSLLLLIAWWTVCLYHRFIFIVIIPLLPISRSSYKWLLRQRREHRGKPHPDTQYTPPDVSTAVKDIEYLLTQLDKTSDFCNLIYYQLDWHNPQVSLYTLRNLLYLYPVWIICAYFLPVRTTVIGLGTIVLLWNSPWARLIRSAVYEYPLAHRIIQATYDTWHIQRATSKRRKSDDGWRAIQSQSAKSGRRPEKELMFRFVVYENQRWWPGVAWNDVLLPNERPSWYDNVYINVPLLPIPHKWN